MRTDEEFLSRIDRAMDRATQDHASTVVQASPVSENEDAFRRRAELAASRAEDLLNVLHDVAAYLDHDTTAKGAKLNARVHAVIASAPDVAIATVRAAAPDLLQAAKDTMDYWDSCGFSDCDEGCACVVDGMRAAIAKAEGRS